MPRNRKLQGTDVQMSNVVHLPLVRIYLKDLVFLKQNILTIDVKLIECKIYNDIFHPCMNSPTMNLY